MGGDGTRSLDQTPTWAVAAVCAVIVAASILLEGLLHHLGQLLSKKRKIALFDALEKVKYELITLGFVSLLLTVTGRYVSHICIPEGAANTMLPCRHQSGHSVAEDPKGKGHGRRHLSEDPSSLFSCPEGMVSLVSADGMHQLHIFVFFLAVFHVTFSFFTMSLGRAKTRIWKVWEKETCSPEYNYLNDPSKFRFTHQTSFVRQHASCWSKSTITLYFVSFFRQFFRSVRRTDYLTLRHGFISAHLSPGIRFNFRKYIKRSLEDDFKTLVHRYGLLLWLSCSSMFMSAVSRAQGCPCSPTGARSTPAMLQPSYPRRLLQSSSDSGGAIPNPNANPNRIPGIPPADPPTGVNSDVVVILAALLCALICVVGLAAVARCARSHRRNRGAAGADGGDPAASPSSTNGGDSGGHRHSHQAIGASVAAAAANTTTAAVASKGLKKKALKALPKLAYADAVAAAAAARGAAPAAEGEEEAKAEELLAECAICLAEFGEREEVRVMPQCGHGFHVACVDTWLRSNSSCPSCRRPIVLDDPAPPKRCRKCEAVVLEAVLASSSSSAAGSGGRHGGGEFLP